MIYDLKKNMKYRTSPKWSQNPYVRRFSHQKMDPCPPALEWAQKIDPKRLTNGRFGEISGIPKIVGDYLWFFLRIWNFEHHQNWSQNPYAQGDLVVKDKPTPLTIEWAQKWPKAPYIWPIWRHLWNPQKSWAMTYVFFIYGC